MGSPSSSSRLEGPKHSLHLGTLLAPPTHISSLDIRSHSAHGLMDGSDDGDTHDRVSELWWEETDNNSNSSDPNSGEMSDDSEEDSEDHPKSIVQDANESFSGCPML